jgi:hypothetical protein
MAKKRTHIEISDNAIRAKFHTQADDAVHATGAGVEWMNRLVNKAGGRDRLAMRLAGTDDKKSRAYKSQRDYISRIVRGGRGIGKGKASILSKAARTMAADKVRQKTGPTKVKIAATWKISSTEWNGAATGEFTGEERETLASLIESGDHDAILDMVTNKYGEEFAEQMLDVIDFEGIEID